jgi:hypothetical protein
VGGICDTGTITFNTGISWDGSTGAIHKILGNKRRPGISRQLLQCLHI